MASARVIKDERASLVQEVRDMRRDGEELIKKEREELSQQVSQIRKAGQSETGKVEAGRCGQQGGSNKAKYSGRANRENTDVAIPAD